MAAGDIDRESLDLIIQLQLQDVQHLSNGLGKGKTLCDLDLAMQLYQADLEALEAISTDHLVSQSLSQIGADEPRLNRGKRKASAADFEHEDDNHNNSSSSRVIAKMKALYVDDYEPVPGDQPESSAWAASRRPAGQRTPRTYAVTYPARAPPRRACTACTDAFPPSEVLRCPCSHEYCRACMHSLFSSAIVDESLFPPRCCGQPILIEGNEPFLGYKLCADFRLKEIEYGTPNRTYCHQPTCSTFIPPHCIQGDKGFCRSCHRRTCTTCKGPAHDLDCPADTQTQEILRMARQNGWQRCHVCRRMVELNTGCNHITCHCGAEFCYVCGLRWKTCTCPQWHEHLLLERAENVAIRDAPREGYNPARLAIAIDQLQQFLQENHDCVEHHWKSRMGRHRCDECRKMMPNFIYECTGCRTLACRQCRFNRL